MKEQDLKEVYVIEGDEKIFIPENLRIAIENSRGEKKITPFITSIIPENSSITWKTVKNWYTGKNRPSEKCIPELLEIINKLDCSGGEVFVSVRIEKEKYEYEFSVRFVENVAKRMRESRISKEFVMWYLNVLKGYPINLLTVWLTCRKRFLPVYGICKEWDSLIEIVNGNRTRRVGASVFDNESMYRNSDLKKAIYEFKRIPISIDEICRYMRHVKGYKISVTEYVRLCLGIGKPSQEFIDDLYNLSLQIRENFLPSIFSLDNKKIVNTKDNRWYVALIMPGHSRSDCKMQLRNINDKLNESEHLNEQYCNLLSGGSTWIDMKQACDYVMYGGARAILVNDINSMEDKELLEKFLAYANYYGIDVLETK